MKTQLNETTDCRLTERDLEGFRNVCSYFGQIIGNITPQSLQVERYSGNVEPPRIEQLSLLVEEVKPAQKEKKVDRRGRAKNHKTVECAVYLYKMLREKKDTDVYKTYDLHEIAKIGGFTSHDAHNAKCHLQNNGLIIAGSKGKNGKGYTVADKNRDVDVAMELTKKGGGMNR